VARHRATLCARGADHEDALERRHTRQMLHSRAAQRQSCFAQHAAEPVTRWRAHTACESSTIGQRRWAVPRSYLIFCTVQVLSLPGLGMTKKAARCASILFCAVFCVAAAHDAAAVERGLYVGGHVGQGSKDAPRDFYELFNTDIQSFAFFTATEQTTSFDDSDTAFGIVVGYRLTPHLAIEGGYNNYGQVTYRSRASGAFPLESGTANVSIDTETTGFTFALLGVLPLTRDWELFARAGALFASNKLSIKITAEGQQFIPPLGPRFAASDSGGTTETYAGVGIGRRFFEIYDLRLEYQRAFDAGHESLGGKGDMDAALLGLIVTF